jgi:Cu-processing system permease protein
MRGMTRDTLVELLDRKVIYLFAAVLLFVLLAIFLTRNAEMSIHQQMPGGDPMEMEAPNPAFRVVQIYMSFLLFLAVMGSAAHIPTMLERGRAEYYLAKPLARGTLLMGKFLGIFTVYGALVVVSGLICYVATAVYHGTFDIGVLPLFLGYVASLFVWLSATTFAAVFSGSTAMTIMTAFMLWAVQLILVLHDKIAAFASSPALGYVLKTLYYIVPKNSEIEQVSVLLAIGQPVPSWIPVWSSLLFAGVVLYAAIFVFKNKDY